MRIGLKITELRKSKNWSQEDLAFRLGVSRQSVSKWESEQATPDIEKIAKLSEIFGVSTDYLIKDAVAEVEPNLCAAAPEKVLTCAEGNEFLATVAAGRRKIALGVMMCIISPIPLITLAALADDKVVGEKLAAVLGIALLLVIVAAALPLFITTGMKLNKYQYIENTIFTPEESLRQKVEGLHLEYEPKFTKRIILGVLMCMAAVVLLIVASVLEIGKVVGINALLLIVSVAVYIFIDAGMLHDSYCQILQQGEYSPENKAPQSNIAKIVGGFYWPLVVVLYLAVSFLTHRWGITWVIWPVAAVLFGFLEKILKIKSDD